ncbi:CtrA inhibitor SciP [Paracoccus sp. 22332]|uniref:CtrA inhibitor SciP n=1 Tax=Paracoccus sp. 22332 TaxID=3453913 RepID=UPI003F82469B
MFLKKTDAPRTVILPDGRILTLADLPPDNTRWVASRKETVVNAVVHGLITKDEALHRYGLSEEEFDGWIKAVQDHGPAALKVTSIQRFRQP